MPPDRWSAGVGLIVASLAIGAVACGTATGTAGDIVRLGIVSMEQLEVGDCFSATDPPTAQVEVVPCERLHRFEVFAMLRHPTGADDPYPGERTLIERADVMCRAPFEAYVGTPYDVSELYISSFNPAAGSWAAGERRFACALRLDEGELRGSQRDTHR